MGLMDREYMHRTPEEREAEYHQKRSKKQISEDQKHKERQLEMYRLMAKGNSMTRSEKRRLEQIYEENRVYMARTATYSNYKSYKLKAAQQVLPLKRKNQVLFLWLFLLLLLSVLFFFLLTVQILLTLISGSSLDIKDLLPGLFVIQSWIEIIFLPVLECLKFS